MLGVLAKYIKDVSTVRRLLFAVVFLSQDVPNFWEIVLEFATAGKVEKSSISKEQIQALVDNIKALNSSAFEIDHLLQKEMIFLQVDGLKPLGIPLVSSAVDCLLCGSPLQLRKDRHAPVVIYDMKHGTIPGCHYHKFCPKRSCSLVQYYGYHSVNSQIIFDPNWDKQEYFLSSRDTGFSIDFMKRADASVLIGQLSFKQQADMYNYTNGYYLCESKGLINSRYVTPL